MTGRLTAIWRWLAGPAAMPTHGTQVVGPIHLPPGYAPPSGSARPHGPGLPADGQDGENR